MGKTKLGANTVKLGKGSDARFGVFDTGGIATGTRFRAVLDPIAAIELCVAQLVDQGFTSRADDLPNRLRAAGSPWTAWAVQIGDAKKSWKTGLLADLVESTVLEFLPGLQRGIAPTLVMVAARPLPSELAAPTGCTEVILFPHLSRTGDPEGALGATHRLNVAVNGIATRLEDDNRLVSREKMTGIRNDGCPASQQAVRELLGWK